MKASTIKMGAVPFLLLCLFFLPTVIKSPYYFHTLNITLIYIIAASSLRTIALSGQISIAHAAFMGVGAYVSAILAKHVGWSPWVTIPLGGFAGLLAGVLVGYPLVRVRAIYFSMVSLFSGMAIVALIGVCQTYTGGDAGLIGIPPLPAINLPWFPKIVFVTSKVNQYYFFLILTTGCLLFLYRVERSRTGTNWSAISQSYLVASSVGINEAKYRVMALSVGCFFAGIAGACYAHYTMTLTRSTFGFLPSINLLIYVLVGGVGNFFGPVLGTAVLVIIPETFRWLKEYAPFIFGGIMLIAAFLMPQGISGLMNQIKEKLNRKSRNMEVVSRAS
jgi:branched-chain amino acid transport system permease protein